MAIDPRMMDFKDWAERTGAGLCQYGPLPTVADEENWQEFAAALKLLPVWAAGDIPDPRLFTEWRGWAARVFEACTRLGL